MKTKIKLENQLKCVACLKEILNETDFDEEIIKIYQTLVQEQTLQIIPDINFCDGCNATLENIRDFRAQCLNALDSLNSQIEFNSIFIIKEEEVEIPDAFEVKLEEIKPELAPPKNVKRKRVPKSTLAKQKPATQKPKTPVKTIPTYKKLTSEETNIFCGICNKIIKNFRVHATVHATLDTDQKYQCNLCAATCTEISELEKHFKSHSEFPEPRKCPDCGLCIKNRVEFEEHIVAHRNILFGREGKAFVCDYCDAIFTNLRCFKRHSLVKHLGAYKCKHCRKPFIDKVKYEQHMEEEEAKIRPKKSFCCEICGFNTKTRTNLLSHIKITHYQEASQITCNECEKQFKTKQYFKQHFFNTHMKKVHQCSQCEKKFAHDSSLRVHVRSHLRYQKSNTCQYCSKQLKSASLSQHIASVHLNLRKYKCDLCDMAFTSLSVFKKHKHSHNKTRPYNCTLCSTGYYNKDYLKNHYQRVHGVFDTTDEFKIIGNWKPD